jgi:LmbE family N-acetylglucosaminyl deacetylase
MSIETRNQNGIEVVRNNLVVPAGGGLFRGPSSEAYQQILDGSPAGRFLIVVAHPDDDFASAGLRARLSRDFKKVPDMALFTMGEGGEDMRTTRVRSSDWMRGMREQELLAASGVMGISTIHMFNEKDGQVKPREDLVLGLASVIRKAKPDLMIIPSGDPREHPDHIAVYEIARRARLLAVH